MYKLELTDQEATVLIQLLDIAVKTTGLNGAESSLILAKKVQEGKIEKDVN